MRFEPDHRMDELLRAYAARRREAADDNGGGGSLPPATRRLLHTEVARQQRDRRPVVEARQRGLLGALFWPGLGLAGSAMVLAGVLAWIWVRSIDSSSPAPGPLAWERELAPAPPAAGAPGTAGDGGLTAEALPAPTASVPPPAANARHDATRLKSDSAGMIPGEAFGLAADAPAPMAASERAELLQQTVQAQGTTKTLAAVAAAAAPPPAKDGSTAGMTAAAEPAAGVSAALRSDSIPAEAKPVAVSASGARARLLSGGTPDPLSYVGAANALPDAHTGVADPLRLPPATEVGRFRRLPDAGEGGEGANRLAATVLSSFKFERRDGLVRILDADGSVYEGPLTGATVAAPRPPPSAALTLDRKLAELGEQSEAVTQTEMSAGLAGSFSFRVSGTNRSLNQFVILHGSVTGGRFAPLPPRAPATTGSSAPVITAAPLLLKSAAPTSALARPGAAPDPEPPPDRGSGGGGREAVPGRFQGTVVIAGTNQVRIEAVRIGP